MNELKYGDLISITASEGGSTCFVKPLGLFDRHILLEKGSVPPELSTTLF
jgi:hypothetical protein